MADAPELTHEAQQSLLSDVRRDHAKAEKMSGDADELRLRKDAFQAEAQTDVTRHHDAN
jgi:hypothetical protein